MLSMLLGTIATTYGDDNDDDDDYDDTSMALIMTIIITLSLIFNALILSSSMFWIGRRSEPTISSVPMPTVPGRKFSGYSLFTENLLMYVTSCSSAIHYVFFLWWRNQKCCWWCGCWLTKHFWLIYGGGNAGAGGGYGYGGHAVNDDLRCGSWWWWC